MTMCKAGNPPASFNIKLDEIKAGIRGPSQETLWPTPSIPMSRNQTWKKRDLVQTLGE